MHFKSFQCLFNFCNGSVSAPWSPIYWLSNGSTKTWWPRLWWNQQSGISYVQHKKQKVQQDEHNHLTKSSVWLKFYCHSLSLSNLSSIREDNFHLSKSNLTMYQDLDKAQENLLKEIHFSSKLVQNLIAAHRRPPICLLLHWQLISKKKKKWSSSEEKVK